MGLAPHTIGSGYDWLRDRVPENQPRGLEKTVSLSLLKWHTHQISHLAEGVFRLVYVISAANGIVKERGKEKESEIKKKRGTKKPKKEKQERSLYSGDPGEGMEFLSKNFFSGEFSTFPFFSPQPPFPSSPSPPCV